MSMTLRAHRCCGFVFTLLLACRGGAGAPPSPAPQKTPVLQRGEKFTFFSKILNGEREYWVHLPASYHGEAAPPAAYPVLYLLDGEDHFQSAVAAVDFLTRFAVIPEMIVVALPSTAARKTEMTPTSVTKRPNGEAWDGRASGGADTFLAALKTELIARIDAAYKTAPYRLLVGRALGGLFAAHAFISEPSLFNAVIALDPSLWWDDQVVVKRAAAAKITQPHARLYVAVSRQPLDGGEKSPSREAALALQQAIKGKVAGTEVETYADEDHRTIAFLGIYNGLESVFDGYKLPLHQALRDPALIAAHYRAFSEKVGVSFDAPPALFELMRRARGDR